MFILENLENLETNEKKKTKCPSNPWISTVSMRCTFSGGSSSLLCTLLKQQKWDHTTDIDLPLAVYHLITAGMSFHGITHFSTVGETSGCSGRQQPSHPRGTLALPYPLGVVQRRPPLWALVPPDPSGPHAMASPGQGDGAHPLPSPPEYKP